MLPAHDEQRNTAFGRQRSLIGIVEMENMVLNSAGPHDDVVGAPYCPRMSWASSEGVRRSMRSNHASGTRPELRLRRALHARGLRFRVQVPVPGAPRRRIDVAFTRLHIAVYLDGCFWHGCVLHPFSPKRNSEYWAKKFELNTKRDADTTQILERHGWTVMRIWEHVPLDEAVATVVEVVDRERMKLLPPAFDGPPQ